MLTELHIKNYAIIKAVDIVFNPKLNIVTGETGAGKSILMGALGLILGDRADSKALLNTEDKCVIEGVFNIKTYGLKTYFEANELDYDDTCILRREITSNGKTRAFINDTPVNLTQLKELGVQLVDIVSQHQTLALNDSHYQLSIVDAIAENNTHLVSYTKIFKQYKNTQSQFELLIAQENKSRQDEDYLTFILQELTEAKLDANEQLQLEKQLNLLSNAGLIQESTGNAHSTLNNDESGVIEQLQQIKLSLNQAAKHHTLVAETIKRINSTIIELKDVAAELAQVADETQANPVALNTIENRLQQLFNLQKKHRVNNTQELIEVMQQTEAKLQNISSLSTQIAATRAQCDKLQNELLQQAELLSERRKKAVPKIEKEVNNLLVQVQMPDAKIKIKTSQHTSFTPFGHDIIELQFCANKGAQLTAISKVASGGELSRLMLCIKSLISDKVALPSIVFDEIDTGISGEAALKVSNVLKNHAQKHQVIAITHLPQIAGKADSHLFVYKTTQHNATHTHIKHLTPNERVEEIARMLHGENPSQKVIEAAKELIG